MWGLFIGLGVFLRKSILLSSRDMIKSTQESVPGTLSEWSWHCDQLGVRKMNVPNICYRPSPPVTRARAAFGEDVPVSAVLVAVAGAGRGREGGQHAESRAEAGEVPLTQRCGCHSSGRTGQPPAPCSAPPPGISAFAVVHSSWFLVPFSATHAVPSLMQCIPGSRPTASCRKAVGIHVQCLSISSAGESSWSQPAQLCHGSCLCTCACLVSSEGSSGSAE